MVAKFERHFVKKRNVIFERAKFNQRKQEEGESVDDFVSALYCLSEHCQYGSLRDEMICDRIVVGLHDSSLSEKLQLEPELTLEKAVTSAHQRESVKKQQKIVRAEESSPNIDAVHSKQIRGKTGEPIANNPTLKQHRKANLVTDSDMCTRCGKHSHFGQQQSPARDATCRKCHRKGHFQVMCRTKSVRALSTEEQRDDTFVGIVEESEPLTIPMVSTGTKPWTVHILLNKYPVEFQIDTGANVVLKRLIKAGITLNSEKCEFSKKCVKFLGHVIDEIGIHAESLLTQEKFKQFSSYKCQQM